MHQLASRVYGDVSNRTATPKSREYALFEQITHDLADASEATSEQIPTRIEAIARNLELWSKIRFDLLDPRNGLPEETKQSLIQLSEFVRQSSQQLLSGEGDVSDLVEINRTIMAGLAGQSAPVQGAVA